MSTTPLTPLTLAEGLELIHQLPINQPANSAESLCGILERLRDAPAELDTQLALLEAMQPALARASRGLAGVYQNRSLPLSAEEKSAFASNLRLWCDLGTLYGRALPAVVADSTDLQASKARAAVHGRILTCLDQQIFEHYLARQELPAGLWQTLNAAYAQTESKGLSHTPIDDAADPNRPTTHCAAIFTTALLLDVLSPYGYSPQHLHIVRRWGLLWASLITIHPFADEPEVPPYVVRLDQDAPLHLADQHDLLDEHTRYLDCSRLSLHLHHLLRELQAGVSPAELDLGEEPVYLVRPLLNRLLRPWTLAASPRKFRRFAAHGGAKVVSSFAAMHEAVLGKVFIQPDPTLGYSRQATDRLYTLGDQIASELPPGLPAETEDWQVINHSANGFRLRRSGPGQQCFMLGQCLAVRPDDGEHFLLCRLNWLMEESAGALMLGVSVIGGVPTASAARPARDHRPYALAFRLPASPITREGPSLLLPHGVYVPHGELDLLIDARVDTVRLHQVIERGAGFDRVLYETV